MQGRQFLSSEILPSLFSSEDVYSWNKRGSIPPFRHRIARDKAPNLLRDVTLVNFSVALLADKVNRLLRKAAWFDYVPPILFIVIAVISIKARF